MVKVTYFQSIQTALVLAAQSMFTESIAEYICGDLVPLSTVDSKHFNGMVKMVSGGAYECHQESTLQKHCYLKWWMIAQKW